MAVEPSDAAELAEINKSEAAAAQRRAALIQKWGEGSAVMQTPGDPYVLLVIQGELRAVAVTYLSGGPTP